jgi:hypothetical protein
MEETEIVVALADANDNLFRRVPHSSRSLR